MDEEDQIVETVKSTSGLTRKFWLFKNTDLLYPLAGIVLGAIIIALTNIGVPRYVAVPLMPVPFFLLLVYFFVFVFRRPPHYAEDKLESLLYGRTFDPAASKKFSHMPNGIFGDNIVIWDDLRNGCWSCGLELDVPAYDYTSNNTKNTYKDRFDKFLRFCAKEGLRVQYYWSVSSNYARELADYKDDTDKLPDAHPCKKYREMRHEMFYQKMQERQLRRERLILYIAKDFTGAEKLSQNLSAAAYEAATQKLLVDLDEDASRLMDRINSFLEPCGIVGKKLIAEELYHLLLDYFNPARALAPHLFAENLEKSLSIKDQVIYSDISKSNNASFRLDGQHYCIFALKAPLPSRVALGMINELTRLNILDYSITVNVIPKDCDKMLQSEESAIQKMENQIINGKTPMSLQYALGERKEMAGELYTGKTAPLDCQYFIAVHDLDENDIQVKATVIKGALTKIGVGYYLLEDTKGAINAFFQATPGWLHGTKTKHNFCTLDKYLSCLLPFSSTYVGNLDGAEALYLGEQRNLVGFKQFAAPIQKDSDPQQTLLFGKTGSGKSVFVADIFLQTYGFYAYSVIIDYGLSYAAMSQKLGTKPIMLGPSSNVTINYFDTNGVPLTGEHLSAVSTILRVMCGEMATDGMLMRYLKPYMLNYAEEWLHMHRDRLPELVSIAMLQEKYLTNRDCDDEIDAWQKASENWQKHKFSADEISSYLYYPESRNRVLHLCFSAFAPEDYPTHTLFVNYLRSKPLADEQDFPLLQKVTDALELWRCDGKNGRLFDGITNINLSSDFEYFELSNVPQNDPNFKFAAGALIQRVVMSKIERMPRHLKKRLFIDEANSFLELPQGAKMIEASYTKYRKHRCPVMLALQQYEMLANGEIAESVVGNVHQFILMSQSDRMDVEKLGQALDLSNNIMDTILRFETPANLPADDRYSSFAQITRKKGGLAGIGRNYMPSEFLAAIGL